ncbi:MAG TPA: AAA family ATPase [Thermogutta sp.]|nr:AAA family ATPase [Thermogutta sp.]
MYGNYWHFREPPFRNQFRRAFFFASPSHQASLLKLRYAIEQREEAALLVGEAGTGKSFLTHVLTESTNESVAPVVRTCCLFDAPEELMTHLAAEFVGRNFNGSGYAALQELEAFLGRNLEEGHHAVLILDDSHLLQSIRSWEVLRSLMTLKIQGETPWTLIVLAQPLFLPLLDRLPQLEELFALKAFLRAWTPEETSQYIKHCLTTAGCDEDVFSPDAVEVVARFSSGIPRRINRLCDLSLLVAFAEKRYQVTAAHVEAVHEELMTVPCQ